jgi:pimeloyl-ACP methyl ester carboxylesterase
MLGPVQTNWKINGSGGEAIHGTTDACESPSCNFIIAHGFKGYKDYGCFPWLANKASIAGARSHRFNFSHSGMLAGGGVFERVDLFEMDTWNKQVEDLKSVIDHCSTPNLPTILLGHSRGGVASLLAVGRGEISVDHLIPLSSPSTCNSLDVETQSLLLSQGYVESPSSRTGQILRVGKCFLEEQIQHPQWHDLLSLASTIEVPTTVIHGEDDQTVLLDAGAAIASVVKGARLLAVQGGNHVFNTPNPFPIDGKPTAQLQAVWEAVQTIISQS